MIIHAYKYVFIYVHMFSGCSLCHASLIKYAFCNMVADVHVVVDSLEEMKMQYHQHTLI